MVSTPMSSHYALIFILIVTAHFWSFLRLLANVTDETTQCFGKHNHVCM